MNNINNISEQILKYYNLIDGDENHRYKSWEHCYKYFTQEKADININTACLHMAFYLSSWGMYRGSSFLLWKDYLIHKGIVEYLLYNKHLQKIDFTNITELEIKEILDIIDCVKNWYQEKIKFVNGERQEVKVTDTLATKIILGTLGCVPAYDTYFIKGIRNQSLTYSGIKFKNLSDVVDFYKNNENNFECVRKKILKKSDVDYPPMKLIDMYFWEIGRKLGNNVTEKIEPSNR